MTSPEYQAPTWVNEDDPAFIEGVSPDLGAGYLNTLSGAVEDHGQRLGAITPVVANLQNTALDQATGDNRYILQTVAGTFAQAEATTTALAGKQPLDADLTALAGLDSTTAGTVASDGAGWVKKTYAQLKTALGLGNVDNTSDANKPISAATQTALNAKTALNVNGAPVDELDIDSSPVGLADLHDVTTAGATVGDVVTFTQAGASPTFGRVTPYGLGAYTVTGVDLTGAVDASAAIQAGIDAQAAKANGGTVYLPAGRYRVDTSLVPKNKVTVIGAGRNLTRLLPYGAIACFERIGSTSSPLDDAHFADFTIDGTNQAGPYATRIKGFYIQWLRRCSFNRLRVYNTGATGVGTDHHVDCEMNDIIAESCGRLNDGTQGGGAGIGIGTGGWLSGSETLVISGCVTKNNKRCGLFFETQNGGLLMGTRVIGHHSEANGEHGIADAGCNGLVVSGGMSKGNQGAGFAMYAGTIDPGQPGTYGIVIGMSLVDNISDGVIYEATTRETANPRYTIRGCKIRGNWSHGVFIRAGATVDPSQLAIVDNDINSNQKAGIYVTSAGASVTDLDISGNRIYANGLNTGAAERQGIRIQCSTTRLRITGNKAWDTQVTKTQTYGLQLSGGTTATDAYFDGNDFRTNATGGANISGTIGNGSVIGPNNAGWTVKAGSPEGAVKAPAGTLYRRTDGDAATTLYVKATNGDPTAGTDVNGWVAK